MFDACASLKSLEFEPSIWEEMTADYFFQVLLVIKQYPDVQKISFIGHSLGGLVARYAIARFYERDSTGELSQENGDTKNDGSGDPCLQEKLTGKIAGLEPMNFITVATPHLGSRGHKQVFHLSSACSFTFIF